MLQGGDIILKFNTGSIQYIFAEDILLDKATLNNMPVSFFFP